MPMRPMLGIFLGALLSASTLAGAQSLEDATRAFDKKEYEKARAMLEQLTTQGNPEAEFKLAGMYVDGIGIPRNPQRGIALYESAARKGNAAAQFFLAMELAEGKLMKEDKKRSVALLRTSAKLKHGGAQVALCMELGSESSKYYDAVEAYAWCEASSNKGHRRSGDAGRKAKSLLKEIQEKSGAQGVQAARIRAEQVKKAY